MTLDWCKLDNDKFYGLEAFLSDGTALDIVEYEGSGEFCWMIRIPIDDAYSTHEVYASYDENVYFSEMIAALDDCMRYLSEYFPSLYCETLYSSSHERKREKLRFLQAAASIGIAVVLSMSALTGTAFGDELNVLEPGTQDNPVSIVQSSDGTYYVGDTDTVQFFAGEIQAQTGVDISPYIISTHAVRVNSDGNVINVEGVSDSIEYEIIDGINAAAREAGYVIPEGYSTICFLEIPSDLLGYVESNYETVKIENDEASINESAHDEYSVRAIFVFVGAASSVLGFFSLKDAVNMVGTGTGSISISAQSVLKGVESIIFIGGGAIFTGVGLL